MLSSAVERLGTEPVSLFRGLIHYHRSLGGIEMMQLLVDK